MREMVKSYWEGIAGRLTSGLEMTGAGGLKCSRGQGALGARGVNL